MQYLMPTDNGQAVLQSKKSGLLPDFLSLCRKAILFCAVNFSAPQGKHDNCARCQSGGHGGSCCRSIIACGLRFFLFPFCGIDGIAGYGFGHLGAPAGEYIARSRGVLAESGSCAVLGKVSEGFILEYYLALHAVGVDNGVFHFRYILLPHGVKRGVLRYFKGVGGSVYNGFSLA